jgi:ubiquinone/menaquinone biosynthesis C-methylase UbiE
MTDTIDAEEYKEEVRSEWSSAAPGWHRWLHTLEGDDAGPVVTRALLDAARLSPGDVVLDVGAGYGEPGLTAARAVGPDGRVVCLDISGDMLAFAEERARAAGLDNVTFVEGDIETAELDDQSFDVVLSRATLMYALDPSAVLRQLRRSLRPGGRIAVTVWATPDRVAFAAPVPVMAEVAGVTPPADGPGPFALGGDGVLEQLVRAAGFRDVAAGEAVAVYETPSREVCTEWLRDVAPPISQLVVDQSAEVQDRVWSAVTDAWAPFEGDDGRVRLPCTAVWVTGTNPE